MVRAIDTFVNVNMGSQERPDYLVRVAEDYFKRSEAIFQDIPLDKMLETMDRCGVEKSAVMLGPVSLHTESRAVTITVYLVDCCRPARST